MAKRGGLKVHSAVHRLASEIDPETAALERISALRSIELRQEQRVRAILLNDRIERARDLRRAEARIEVADGKFASLDDAKETPTPEQLASGDFVPVHVDNPMETVREPISTVKRVDRIWKLWRRGVLEDHEYRACRWYRTRWERSGLDPLSASTIAPNFGVGERAYGHMAKTEAQAQARSDYRWAREQIPVDVRKLFDAVVIDDLSIDDAARIVRLRYRNAQAGFRRAVLVLFDAVKDDLRLDLPIAP